MAPGPSTSHDPDHHSGRALPRNPQSSRHNRPTPVDLNLPDLNRPLPPPPASATEPYEIPSLRRRPAPDVADSNTPKSTHNRSFSHPFPNLFGSKRSERKHQGKGEHDGTSSVSRDGRMDDVKAKATGQESASHRADRQPVTGRCMTCDSTVRWPQGLKVFRCTTCLTINDLEPSLEQRHESSGSTQGPPPQRRIASLSLDRTRALLDRCLEQYLDSLLEDIQEMDSPEPLDSQFPTEESFLLDGSPPEGLLYSQNHDDQDSPPQSPRPAMKPRSPSESTLSTLKTSHLPGGSFVQGSSADPFSSSLPTHGRPHTARTQDPTEPKASAYGRQISHSAIFRQVENYIARCFVGCATLNNSFLLSRPPPNFKPRTGSGAQSRRQPSEPVPSPLFEADVFLSEFDAKTLLLGDIAENGSWWLGTPGGRSSSTGQDTQHQRDKSPDKGRTPGAKYARINWIELAEWYRVVVYAGDAWESRWQAMKSRITNRDQLQRWDSVSMSNIHHDIMDSRIHLHRSLLKVSENLLKRPRQPLKHSEDCRFLLILLANPLLTPTRLDIGKSSNPSMPKNPLAGRGHDERLRGSPSKRIQASARRPGSLGHHSGIIKRILGLIANLSNEIHQLLVSWFSKYSDGHFQRTVEMIGSFVTYRLSRQQRRPAIAEPVNPTDGLVPSFSDSGLRHASQIHAALEGRPSSTSAGNSDGKPKLSSYGEDWQIRVAARVMSLFFQANVGHAARKRDAAIGQEQRHYSPGMNAKYNANSHGQIIPVSNFYNTMLDYADLVADFETWETTKSKFTFCQYPFFLSIYAKIHILEHDARRQMEVKAREAFFDSILSRKAVSQYLVLKVRRDCLVEDSLRSVSEAVGSGGSDLKKGLRIDFQGEEGIDAGGLRKEWFLLLVREIFDPNHGLFIYDDDSQYCYFNPFCFESSEQFFLVGVLLGMAIYNSTILDVAFPPFVFKKMLASAPSIGDKLTSTPRIGHGFTLEDLAEFRPALARGFRQLLEFEGDVQETFCRDFVAEMDRYGEVIQVPLFPGGEKRAVTNSNRKDFVDLYVHYLLDTAVARQYEPFKRGFFTVCGGNALSLFRPEEIELLVRGSDESLDVASLRAVATYEGWPKHEGPPEQQPQVMWFWDFLSKANPGDQRKILSFITGSDRIPAMGATNLVIRIQLIRAKDEFDVQGRPTNLPIERFPIARTCFNTLSLFKYESRQKLEHKLWMAVTNSEGFGLK
jgi:E3 ubiquitin-protein ligase HECTD2